LFSPQQTTQQNKNIMFLYITCILTLIANPVHPSPFPDQILYSNEQNSSQQSSYTGIWNYPHPKTATGKQTNSTTHTHATCMRSLKNWQCY